MVRQEYTYLCILITQNCFQDQAFVSAILSINCNQILLFHDTRNYPFIQDSDIPMELKDRVPFDTYPFILDASYFDAIWNKLKFNFPHKDTDFHVYLCMSVLII